ncbi:MAG: hypothetical protein M3N29_09075 [Chloroflexota bacterium]|nr:hypothetical protein [Chloroflexota bacterium]
MLALRQEALLGVGGCLRALREPLALDVRRTVNQPHLVTAGGQPTLDELDRLERDERDAIGDRRPQVFSETLANQRVDDAFEVTQRARVGEDHSGQRRPVELAGHVENAIAEARADGGQCRLTRTGDLARQRVGVDDAAAS